MTISQDTDLELIFGGTANEIASGLQDYSRAASVLSSNQPRLIDEHPNEWVGIFCSRVAAHGATLDGVMEQLREQGIAAGDAIVRFIDTEERTLIL